MKTDVVNASKNRLIALENSKKKALLRIEKSRLAESRFAIFRLTFSVLLLSYCIYLVKSASPLQTIFIFCSFAITFAGCSLVHSRLKNRLSRWVCYEASLKASVARLSRDFTQLKSLASVWHEKVNCADLNSHPYANDLDIDTLVFLWLNSCGTVHGSKKLLSDLLSAGVHPATKEQAAIEGKRVLALQKLSPLLRRLEMLRFKTDGYKNRINTQDLQHQNLSAAPDEIQKPNFEKAKYAQRELQFLRVFCIASIFVWFITTCTIIYSFLQGAQFVTLATAASASALMPLIGVFAFQNILSRAEITVNRAGVLREFVNIVLPLKNLSVFKEISVLTPDTQKQIKNMSLILDLVTMRSNQVFWFVVHLFLPFESLLGLLLSNKLAVMEKNISLWETEVAKLDALAALARAALDDCSLKIFPTVAKSLSVEAEALGHPLIPAHLRICNNVTFTENSPIMLLTGSNMAGKSTFLRALGLNIVLYNICGLACAQQFNCGITHVLCAIRIQDSLSSGSSYFLAEVDRIAEILKKVDHSPAWSCIFFVDEIFKGTNNEERFIGSWSVIESLASHSAFGIVSTHDLALHALEQKTNRIVNAHFGEEYTDGKIFFSYILKTGPCRTTNALYLMASRGLPIDANQIMPR